jgi:hypothetical protein
VEDFGKNREIWKNRENWKTLEELEEWKNRENWKTIEELEDGGRIGRTGRPKLRTSRSSA